METGLDWRERHATVNTGAESDVDISAGGSDLAEFWRLSLQALHAPLLVTGIVDADLLSAAQAQLTDSAQARVVGAQWITVWGCRPAD